MQIALTKKLADAMKAECGPVQEDLNPLFTWTANWTKVWDNRRTEDMLVLVNNVTRFTVAIYQVKRKDLKNVAEKMRTAISNTLRHMNINPEIVDEYMSLAGEVSFIQNHNRQAASWVTKAGVNCAYAMADKYYGIEKIYSDTAGAEVNKEPVNYSAGSKDGFYPYEAMMTALSELTGMQAYKYRAFELLVTLDLDIYKAERRIIVPANLEFYRLHKVLQSVYEWRNRHLYDFTVYADNTQIPAARIVPFDEDLDWDENALLMEGHTLAEFMPEYSHIVYTYDMGDYWQHEIRLIRVIEDYDKESPCLLEAVGQGPPEDVGGIGGFIEFRKIMLNPNDPEYRTLFYQSGCWTPELSEWASRPRVIR